MDLMVIVCVVNTVAAFSCGFYLGRQAAKAPLYRTVGLLHKTAGEVYKNAWGEGYRSGAEKRKKKDFSSSGTK